MTDPTAEATAASGRAAWRGPVLALAAVTYLPLLLTQPGWISADTKTYLYLDPTRLLSRAWSMWDPSIGAGTVTHQNIGYLWPMGPFYWVADQAGIPDWAAQRIWWASILFAAGAGVVYLLRRFAWSGPGIWAAAFVYAMSPYVLALVARLSGVLLPYAALPWLLALTIQTSRTRGWRHPAAFALVVATAGSVNLTALVLVGVAPVLWIVHAVVSGELSGRRAVRVVARLAVPTVAVNAWWLAGLSVQATNGLDIVRYTETAEVVAATSTAHEVMRGLGYWFFYGGDRLGPWIEPGVGYTQHLWLIALTYLLPVVGLLALGTTRWRHRRFFAALVVVGTLLAVGAHPWDSPPPLGRAVRWFLLSDRGLAMRSLPRAIPVLVLGLGVLTGSAVVALNRRRPSLGRGAGAGIAVLAVLALPPLWQGDFVPANLRRAEDLPAYWSEAAAAVDRGDPTTRVLAVPGSDFAAYRWGNTVDPVLPGITDRPFLARELIPYGSPASANLLNAFDLALQERRLPARAVAPIARLLRAGDILVRSDLQYERYNTPRPRLLWDMLTRAPGLGQPEGFGAPTPNEPVAQASLRDEVWLLRERTLPDPPPLALLGVVDPVELVSAQPSTGALLVAGDGAGLVDAAGAGLIDGTELIRYSAAMEAGQIAAEAPTAALLVTDTNRRRGERWTTIRHNRGYTEPTGLEPLERDLGDNRLPVFPDAGPEAFTVAVHRGGVTARATSYGNPITYFGEDRPPLAVDGDPSTAWRTGDFSDARGERLRLDFDDDITTDRIRLLQPQNGYRTRHITKVRLTVGDRSEVVALDGTSLEEPGQVVRFPTQTFRHVELEILADTAGDRPRFGGQSSVGFAEVAVGEDPRVLDELIRLPVDLLEAAGSGSADRPLALLMTRIRQDSADPTRDDEERSIVRVFELPGTRSFALAGAAHLSARAPEAPLDALLGQAGPVVATSDARLPGALAQRAVAAVDGDPSTAWVGPFGRPTGVGITIDAGRPVPLDQLPLELVADGAHSVPTEVEIIADGQSLGRFALPPLSDRTTPGATVEATIDLPPATARIVTVRVTQARAVYHDDWFSGGPIEHPVAIAEVGLDGVRAPAPASRIDTGCRTDLVTVDGEPFPVRVSGSTSEALDGGALDVRGCSDLPLGDGEHVLRAAPGRLTGVDLDQVVLRSGPDGSADAGNGPLAGPIEADPLLRPDLAVTRKSPYELEVAVSGASPHEPFWLVLGESHNTGWVASSDRATVGRSQLVDGFANGFLVDPAATTFRLDLRFAPQSRVNVALALSAVSAAICLALLWRRPRPLPADHDRGHRPPPSPRFSGRSGGDVPPPRRAVVTAALVGVGLLLILPPPVAGALALCTWAATRRRWVRTLTAVAPAVLLACCGAFVVVQQLRHQIRPGSEWPVELQRVHGIALAAIGFIVVHLASTTRREEG